MQIAVVNAAQRHRDSSLTLRPSTRLPKLDVMRVGWTPATDEARLRTYEVSMRLIALSDRLHKRDRVLIILHRP
jgi:hypothetical protein